MINGSQNIGHEDLKSADSEAFIKIYQRYVSKVYHFALSLTKSPEDAEEITSDVFVKIWQKMEILDADISPLPLLIKITRDLTWNHLKRISRAKSHRAFIETYLETVVESSADQLIFNEYQEIVTRALNDLTPQQRKVFSLRYFTGKDLNQISEELQISKNTVKVHLANSKKLILHALPFTTI